MIHSINESMKNDSVQKVVFQLSSNDTFIQKSLIRQLASLLEAVAGIRIEVVAHSYGVDLLLEGSAFKKSIETLGRKGVYFLACKNTITREKMDKVALLPLTRIIPGGLAHIIQRQSEGWSYIKAGY